MRYYFHATTDDLHFFWNAKEEPYPITGYHTEDGYQIPENIDYGKIDFDIVYLIQKINGSNYMRTVMSCAGHPENDNAYSSHVEIWIRILDAIGISKFFEWIARARIIRQTISTVFKNEILINADFVGVTKFGYYFIVYGHFVSKIENQRIIQALMEAL